MIASEPSLAMLRPCGADHRARALYSDALEELLRTRRHRLRGDPNSHRGDAQADNDAYLMYQSRSEWRRKRSKRYRSPSAL